MTTSTKSLHNNQDGIVAIAVSMIVMIIISLLTLGFARLMQREQRQALDRQLSTQAFYAAESAINDARQILQSGGTPVADKTKCAPEGSFTKSGNIADGGTVAYTCLLVNSALPDIRYSDIGSDGGRIASLQTNNNDTANRLRIEWERNSDKNDFSAGNLLPPVAGWPLARPDMIRAVVFKEKSGYYESRTYFLTPAVEVFGADETAGSVTYGDPTSNNGQIVQAHCKVANPTTREYACRADILGDFSTRKRTSAGDGGGVLIGLTTTYRGVKTSVKVSAYHGNGVAEADQLLLVNSQYRIDATGKANDVLRRLQVRVSQSLDTYFNEPVIQSANTLCKRFITAPGDTSADPDEGCLP